jgi:ectoine hydroxylase-related dioxygenase (phytanoyl-CoA dioxygenase family)
LSIVSQIQHDGYALAKSMFSEQQVKSLRDSLIKAIKKEAEFHGTTEYPDFGRVLCCPDYNPEFLNVLENELFIQPFEDILGESCIVYVYTSSSVPPKTKNFAVTPHVDVPRFLPGYCEMVGALILLDDFSHANGGTKYMPGSHKQEQQPEDFEQNACILTADAGSVFYFDSRLWHASAENQTDKWRHALSIGIIRPYLKQRFDLPKMFSNRFDQLKSEKVKQKLGLYANPPASLEEYYRPKGMRSDTNKSF